MKPTVSEEQARYIVETRRDQLKEGHVMSWPEFIAELRSIGTLSKPVSVPTIRKIVEGKYYPHLTDLDGNPYVWEKLPVAGRKGDKPSTQQELELLKSRVAMLEKLEASFDRLDYRFDQFERRLTSLENQNTK